MTKPKKWPHNMLYLRDLTAEQQIAIYRRAKRLQRAIAEGKISRDLLVSETNLIIEASMRSILNLNQAGAHIDVNALDELL